MSNRHVLTKYKKVRRFLVIAERVLGLVLLVLQILNALLHILH